MTETSGLVEALLREIRRHEIPIIPHFFNLCTVVLQSGLYSTYSPDEFEIQLLASTNYFKKLMESDSPFYCATLQKNIFKDHILKEVSFGKFQLFFPFSNILLCTFV